LSRCHSTDAVSGPPRARGLLERSRYRAAVINVVGEPERSLRVRAQIVQGTNEVRRAKGLPTLGGSTCAQDAALQRASALIGKTELTHAPLGGVIADCASGTTAAENLSKAAATPGAVIDAWMHSPGHRSNLLDPTLTQIGVGCVLDGQAMLCSQVFLGP